jgi:hypothetical protein
MRFIRYSLLLAASLVPLDPAAAADGLRVLHSDARGLEVEWTLSECVLETVSGADGTYRRPSFAGGLHLAESGAPDLPSIVELVALPPGSNPRVRVVSVTTASLTVPDLAPAPRPVVRTAENGEPYGAGERRLEKPFPAALVPGRWAEIDGTVSMRGSRVARLVLHPWRYDASGRELQWASRLRVRIEFDGPDARGGETGRRDHAEWDQTLSSSLLNGENARRWRRPRRLPAARGTADSFDSSPNWLKVPILTDGIYRIDYTTFDDVGIDAGGVDPTTIRVFSGTNMTLPEDLTELPLGFMTECAILDTDPMPDTILDLEDRLLFYALDAEGWGSQYDPALPRDMHVENRYTDVTYYWITWGGNFSTPPKRLVGGNVRSVTPDPGATFVSSAPHRIHFEENNVEEFRYPDEDGWMWEDLLGRGDNRRYFMDLDRVASGDGKILARILSYGEVSGDRVRHVQLKLGSLVVADTTWLHGALNAVFDMESAPLQGLLREGSNTILVNVVEDSQDASDHVYTTWFDVEYDRQLTARNGRYLSTYADSAGTVDWVYDGFRSSEAYLLDVTDQHDVVRLVDFELDQTSFPYQLRFSEPQSSTPHWYVAFTMDGVRTLETPEIVTFTGADGRRLRDINNSASYLVIYHPNFVDGANRLARLRVGADPDTDPMTVNLIDVYNEFSWGMRDAVAIRDFLAYAYSDLGWVEAPLYVALVGDAAFDHKGFLAGSPEDLLPSYLGRYRTESIQEYVTSFNQNFYSTDDFFGYVELEDYDSGAQPALDFAIGRYPVSSAEDLEVMLDKLESYLSYSSPGQWQNRVILSADDERVRSGLDFAEHTAQVEELAQFWLPPALDRVKVYLTEYPRDDFGKKPTAQDAFIEEFTRGALMTTYTGHGDQNTLAQEEVFVSQKIPELLNEDRYTVFSTFSCTVSRFDLLSGNSMTELMLLHEGGGAVATFASGGLVFPEPSSDLNTRWLGEMFGTPYIVPTNTRHVRSIALSGMLAKVDVASSGSDPTRQNNEKYVMLGDPALEVRFGRNLIRFEAATVDSHVTDGTLRVIRGDVRNTLGEVLDGTQTPPPGEQVSEPFSGTAFVHVTENADTSGYEYPDGSNFIPYKLDGPTSYRGEIPVTNGRFEAKFYLAETVLIGNQGRISVFALEEGVARLARDASGAYDSLFIAPTISANLSDDTEGPRIRIRFEGFDNFVDGDLLFVDTPILNIGLEDESGINLRPFPQFALLEAEVDDIEKIDLSADFTYGNGSFTQGRVRRILPMAPGAHSIEVKAFDNVGNRSSQRVHFTIVQPGGSFDLVDSHVAVYPNPFANNVDILFRLTPAGEAEVSLKIFTITGRRVYERVESFVIDPQADYTVRWDGRDDNGTPLANGTYLYKLEATHRADGGETEKDAFTGKIVRMR